MFFLLVRYLPAFKYFSSQPHGTCSGSGGQATVSPQGNRQALLCQCTQTISQSDICEEGGWRGEEKGESDRYALFESNGSEGEREKYRTGQTKRMLKVKPSWRAG